MEGDTIYNRALSRHAQQDPDGFIAKHFLDNQRRPDRSKTPSLLCVFHMDDPDERSDLHQSAGAVEGLFHAQRTLNDGHTNIYLGWYKEAPSRPDMPPTTAQRRHLTGSELQEWRSEFPML